MPISSGKSLRELNTFHIDSVCREYAAFEDVDTLRHLLAEARYPPFILGGGSNILLPDQLDRTVLHNCIPGIAAERRPGGEVWLTAGAGVLWHDLVTWAVSRGWGGLENLALIPGMVGAAPIQNIGAYGVELADVFIGLEALERATGHTRWFDPVECAFGYRDSWFKQAGKEQWVILQIRLRLQETPSLHLDYGDIRRVLTDKGVPAPGIRDVYEAVLEIRRSKLPDPAQLGNAGSFFKNPLIPDLRVPDLRAQWPDIPCYPASGGQVKVAAGWLIEKAGWKGYRRGDCGVHEKQALVLVNYGKATARDIRNLAGEIIADVDNKFGIHLEPEVNLLVGSE